VKNECIVKGNSRSDKWSVGDWQSNIVVAHPPSNSPFPSYTFPHEHKTSHPLEIFVNEKWSLMLKILFCQVT